jgi:pimeloyl-ACP methyl ester carboxylesterase
LAPARIAVVRAALVFVLVTPALLARQTDQARQREQFANAAVQYDFVSNSRGDKLRTFVTKPKSAAGKVPVIFFVGWLSCDSVEYFSESDGFGALIRRLIDQSGYATVRVDKPGVGESTGTPCAKSDFQGELEGYRAAFDSIRKYDFIDPQRVFVVGLSNGGGVGPLVSQDHHVAGFVAAASWGRTWYEHMLENERVRLTTAHKPAAEVNDAVKVFTQFYDLYLVQGETPGEIIRQHPQWQPLWYDAPDGQYGRPAAFYQQLQAVNLGEAWQKVSAPVLVIHGGADTIMSHADSVAIADIVNAAHPRRARFVDVPGMAHDFIVNMKFHAELVPLILNWMKEALSTPKTSTHK